MLDGSNSACVAWSCARSVRRTTARSTTWQARTESIYAGCLLPPCTATGLEGSGYGTLSAMSISRQVCWWVSIRGYEQRISWQLWGSPLRMSSIDTPTFEAHLATYGTPSLV